MSNQAEVTVLTFLFSPPRRWRELRYAPYTAQHVNALERACRARIKVPHKFLCVTDDPQGLICETMPLWDRVFLSGHDSCYLRLGAFDRRFQKSLGTPYVMCLDLDVILYKDCTQIVRDAMEHDFAILQGSKYSARKGGQLCSYYNGGFWVCKSGARHNFWTSIHKPGAERLRETFKMPSGKRVLGSDQAWISIQSQNEHTIDPESGATQFRYLQHGHIPPHVKMVFFAGTVKPWDSQIRTRWPRLYREWERFA